MTTSFGIIANISGNMFVTNVDGLRKTVSALALVRDALEFKPHLRGDGDKVHHDGSVLYETKALTSNGVLPHCDYEGLSTLGLEWQRTSSPLLHAQMWHHTEEVTV